MKAVVDTNVWVSAFLTPAGKPAKLFDAIYAGRLVPVLSAAIAQEYRSVLARARFNIDREILKEFFGTLASHGHFEESVPTLDLRIPDPSDAPFIELARHAACPVITGNSRHFPAGTGVMVLTPAEWLLLVART